jgi:hypothetical protein
VAVTFLCLLTEIKRGAGEKIKENEKERESILMPYSTALKTARLNNQFSHF